MKRLARGGCLLLGGLVVLCGLLYAVSPHQPPTATPAPASDVPAPTQTDMPATMTIDPAIEATQRYFTNLQTKAAASGGQPQIAPTNAPVIEQSTSAPNISQPTVAPMIPHSCATARAMGLTAQQIAQQYPGLDADHDGVACYGS